VFKLFTFARFLKKNLNSGSNSAASPLKTKEERANLKNRFAIFEIFSLHKYV
jgi:hypothetical protein